MVILSFAMKKIVMTESFRQLSKAYSFKRDGYLIIPKVLDRNECMHILKIITDVESKDHMITSIHGKGRKDMMLPLNRVRHYIRKIYKKTEHIWSEILHDPILYECSSLISYPDATHQIWHVDTYYKKDNASIISIGIALTDITEDMGPLHVMKGRYVKKEKVTRDDIRVNRKGGTKVKCIAKQGDLVAWSSHIIHRGSANVSDKIRPVFYFSIASSNAPISKGSTHSILEKKKIYMKNI